MDEQVPSQSNFLTNDRYQYPPDNHYYHCSLRTAQCSHNQLDKNFRQKRCRKSHYKHQKRSNNCHHVIKTHTIQLYRPNNRSRIIHSKMPKHFKTLLTNTSTLHPLSIYNAVSIILVSILATNFVQCSTHLNKSHSLDKCRSIDELVQPMIFNNSNQEFEPLSLAACPENLRIYFSSLSSEFVIDLSRNKRLIGDSYFKIQNDKKDKLGHPIEPSLELDYSIANESGRDSFYESHKFLQLDNNNEHCHYHGLVNDNLNSMSAISILNHRLLSGFLYDGTNSYYLTANTEKSSTILSGANGLKLPPTSTLTPPCPIYNGQESDLSYHSSQDYSFKHRFRRSPSKKRSIAENKVLHGPFQSNSSSLYVELLVVHDHSQFIYYNRNATVIAERTMQIVNIVNAFYKQLNIFVALVGVVLWTEKDKIELTDDGDSTLTSFLKYRYENLLPRYHHDNAQLVTSTSFNGSVVGKALKGPICTHDHSGGVNTAHSHNPAIVAVTLAHELGHNLGMEHDEDDKCKCPDEKCIMSSSSSTVHPKHWSSCSIDYLEDSRKHGLLDCLINEPKEVFGPICGNGLVEEGEDCDLGEPIPSDGTSRSRKNAGANARCSHNQDCDQNSSMNPCCDRQTCKFMGNATCAQGPCCDLTRCSVYNATEPKVCRQRKTECDFEEICDGKSEYCPPDVFYHDGIQCGPTLSSTGIQPPIGSSSYNRSRAYCYNGRCSSHESQCQLLWGPTGYSSKDICYEQNVHGNTSGNCGYNRKDKTYDSCEPEDAICGMLHCVHNQPASGDSRKTGKLGYGFESASILTVSFFVMSNQAKIYCHGAIVDAGPGIHDPGLVPNGAACGEDMMCLNQKCVPVYDVLYKNWCPSDCNGNGICDNMGICHCNDGTIGTSCYQFFGANFHLSLLLYIIMFFGPMVALIMLAINHYRRQIKIWWFLHNRKIALRNKAREPNQQRRLTYDVGNHKISISEPIPLNQQNNTNRPFYEPVMDPWTETKCDTGGAKSPGYRLEPMQRSGIAATTTMGLQYPSGGQQPFVSAPDSNTRTPI